MSGRGGSRDGAGRPPGSPNKESKAWPKFGTTISAESKAWLEAKKAEGRKVNILVDAAIKLLIKKED